MIAASLATAAVVIFFVLQQKRDVGREYLQHEGRQLLRIASRITPQDSPLENLLPAILPDLAGFENTDHFAFLAVIRPNGSVVDFISRTGISLPTFPGSSDPGAWYFERDAFLPGGRQKILEFSAPLLQNGEFVGALALGFLEPDISLTRQYRKLLSDLFLPIFLLGTIFYLLFKKESSVIASLRDQIRKQLESEKPPEILSVKASGDVQQLVDGLNVLLRKNLTRLEKVEQEHVRTVDSGKIVQYKKTRLEAIFEAMPDGIAVLDDSCNALFANRKFADLLCLENRNVIGHHFLLWSNADQLSAFFSKYQGGRDRLFRTATLDFTPKARPDRSLRIMAFPLSGRGQDESGAIGTLIVVRDVTAESLSRKARDEFVAQVSHELKTPLNVIKMYNEMLLGEDGSSESFRIEAINTINDAVERLNLLIKNLLSISQIEMGSIVLEKQRVKLPDLLRDAFELTERTADRKANLSFKLEIPSQMSPVNVDKDLLRVAINNLLSNAVKYNREGGSIFVSAEETADGIFVRVRDTGIGISKEDQQYVFNKFYRSESEEVRQRSGHGLGLSLAKAIVELHNGKLTVDSVSGEGTEFTIMLRKSGGLVKEGI